ncbi:hypothetical protein P5673_009443 [Acropora cervicornis]|uniref:Uncharacterized protein n=1 Tax=Acropora cervicornis TaxID=6130 RepID=A0AAD9VAG2_ACRCE|nr:hypothetical protein P5673_009443 [Acropora cervicornis]
MKHNFDSFARGYPFIGCHVNTQSRWKAEGAANKKCLLVSTEHRLKTYCYSVCHQSKARLTIRLYYTVCWAGKFLRSPGSYIKSLLRLKLGFTVYCDTSQIFRL